jgi:maltose O-acetyltransferase
MPDRWLVRWLARFVHWRYGETLRAEAHKWERLTEENRLMRLKAQLAACGEDVTLRTGVQIFVPENVRLGTHVAIGYNSILQGKGGITLENFTLLGDNVILATSSHPTDGVRFHTTWEAPIHIGENAWLGAGVIVLPGVTIGENAVIGAGAVVTEDIPADSVAVGVPARVAKRLTLSPQTLQAQKRHIRAKRLARIGSHSSVEALFTPPEDNA